MPVNTIDLTPGGGPNAPFGLEQSTTMGTLTFDFGNSSLGAFSSPGMSALSVTGVAMVVQGSASSFSVVPWAAVRPGDLILTTVLPDTAVSSLSSGLVLHSHCTQAGQFEMRWSNVSTLVQNQSAKSYGFVRIGVF